MTGIHISAVTKDDLPAIQALAHQVAGLHVYPGLTTHGQQALRQSLDNDTTIILDKKRYHSLKAIRSGKIVAYIAWRTDNHIAQLYVDSTCQEQGIGTRLVNEMMKHTTGTRITVRSSVNAVGFYRRLGFIATGEEKQLNGIRYVPMTYTLKSRA